MRSTALRLLLALALCVGFLAACGNDDDANGNGNGNGNGDANGESAVPADWETYTDDATGFRFALPDRPEVVVEPVPLPEGGSLELTVYFVDLAGRALLIGFNPVPPSGFGFAEASDGAVEALGGTLTDNSSTTVEGHDARDAEAVFVDEGEDGLALMRVLVIGDTAIQLQTIGDADAEDELRSLHDAMLAGFEY